MPKHSLRSEEPTMGTLEKCWQRYLSNHTASGNNKGTQKRSKGWRPPSIPRSKFKHIIMRYTERVVWAPNAVFFQSYPWKTKKKAYYLWCGALCRTFAEYWACTITTRRTAHSRYGHTRIELGPKHVQPNHIIIDPPPARPSRGLQPFPLSGTQRTARPTQLRYIKT